jgi:putative transposase
MRKAPFASSSGLVLDWGKEFGSEFLETLTAIHQIRIIKRPPHQARHGCVIERQFGKLNKAFFHNLRGNTQNTRNVRQLTKSMDPKRFAVWSLETLHEHLSRFCFETYDQLLHAGIGTTPVEAYERGLATAGSRPWRRVEYNETFKLLTMATTPKGTARIQPGLGVKIRYFYYWAEEMRDPQWERKEVPVRFDQEDLGVAYARIAGRWLRCISCHYDTLKGKSEKQLKLAVAALRRRRSLIEGSRTTTARQIARFFESVEGEEVLREQRMKDMARERILESYSGGPVVAAAISAKHGLGTVVQHAEEQAAPPDTDLAPAAGPVFEDF